MDRKCLKKRTAGIEKCYDEIKDFLCGEPHGSLKIQNTGQHIINKEEIKRK